MLDNSPAILLPSSDSTEQFKPLLEFESEDTRLEINLQQTEDRDTGGLTDNYALYLSVAERG
jgi:hypothetical protein